MIDTITIRVHDLVRHEKLMARLSRFNDGMSIMDKMVEPHNHDSFTKLQYLRFNDTGKQKMFYKNKLHFPSSHYNLNYSIQSDRDFMQFEFSIPKLIHGSNVFQFLTHKDEKMANFDAFKMNSIEWNAKNTYKKLNEFLDMFFDFLYPDYRKNREIHSSYVEINRLDICYNQLFASKQEAFQYLNYQKKIRKKFARSNEVNKRTFRGSVFYYTKDYSAKIYFKGDEYKKNDRYKHIAHNRKMKSDFFPVDGHFDLDGIFQEGLQDVADRTLRYEISFKNQFMSRLYKTEIFRASSPKWKKCKEAYKHIRSIERKMDNKNLSVPVRHSLFKEMGALDKDFKEKAEMYNNVHLQRNTFMLSNPKDIKHQELNWMDFPKNKRYEAEDRATWSEDLWSIMFGKFADFFRQYQVKEKIFLSDFEQKLLAYNEAVKVIVEYNAISKKKKIQGGPLRSTVLLLQTYSWDDLSDLGIMAKRTMQYQANQFKKLGIDPKGVMTSTIKGSKDFEYYHALTMTNPNFESSNMWFK